METHYLKRTVLIGLGGTGKQALLHAKRRFVETFGEVPPIVKFLVIDTTNANPDSIPAITPDGEERKVRLGASELLHIEARGASLLPLVHDEIREWFPPKAGLKANILSGAGQVRALGRLALFANAKLVYDTLRNLLTEARDFRNERPRPESDSAYAAYTPHMTVCVAGSLAGGTGSGTFLDVAMVLRDLMKDEDQLFGYLLLPDIYTNRPGTQNVEANAYGALVELDHCMNMTDVWSYPFGGRTIDVRKKPFDMAFLINQQNRAGKAFKRVEDLTELMGTGLFLVAGPLGKDQADIFDNVVVQLAAQQGRFYGKSAHYASFGAAELRFRPGGLDDDRAIQTARQATDRLLSDVDPWAISALENRARSLTSLAEPDPGLKPPGPSGGREQDATALDNAERDLATQRQTWTTDAVRKWSASWAFDLPDETDRAFGNHTLVGLRAGLERLGQALESWARELGSDRDARESAHRESLEKLREQVVRNRPAPAGLLGRRADPQGESVVTGKAMRRLFDSAREWGLAQARVELVDRLLRDVTAEVERLKTVEKDLRRWTDARAARQAGVARHAEADLRPFTLSLPPPSLGGAGSAAPPDPDERVRELRSRGLRALCDDPERVLDEVFRAERANTLQGWLRAALGGNDDTRAAVERAFRELDELAAPAWDYQDAWVSNPNVGNIEQIYMLGVADGADEKDPVRGQEVQDIFVGHVHKLQYVTTRDPNRIYFYKIEASIPAFTLAGIELYREKYQTLSARRSFHIRADWEHLDDVMPLPQEEDVADIWTRARLLGLVEKRADDCYRFKTEREGLERWHELGRSPSEAFVALGRDFFRFKDLEDRVKAGWRQQSGKPELRDRILLALQSREDLLAETDDWSEEDRRILAVEAAELDRLRDLVERWKPRREDTFLPA